MKNTLFILLSFLVFAGHAQESYTLSKESALKISGSSTIHDWTVMANAMKGSMNMKSGVVDNILVHEAVSQIKS